MCALHRNMCFWATCSPSIYFSSSVSHLCIFLFSNPSVPVLLCVRPCVSDDSERSIWHCPKERWRKPGWKAPHSFKSYLRWQTLRPQRMMPHMLTVLPCCCVSDTKKWHLTEVKTLRFALNMQPFSYKMFALTSRPPCCQSLTDICLWSQNTFLCSRCIVSAHF